jgi:enamine deaminase RidA (YjgF/YER057c/UK114 family)
MPVFPRFLVVIGCCVAWGGTAVRLSAADSPPAGGLRYLEPDDALGLSQAVVVPEQALLHTAQFTGAPKPGQSPAEAAGQALDELAAHLRAAGSDLRHVVKLNVCVADPLAVPVVRNALIQRFPRAARPAVSYVVTPLIVPEAIVAFDAVAALRVTSTNPQVFFPPIPDAGRTAPFQRSAVLPAGGVVYVSGQAEPGALADATRKTLESLATTLKHLGLAWSDVVQLKAFLQPMTEWRVAAREIESFTPVRPVPPVVFVEWISSGKSPIEIELIASAGSRPSAARERIEFLTPPGMKASPVYSRMVRVNHGPRIYTAGLHSTGAPDAAGQVREIFETVGELLAGAQSDLSQLAKATYYVTDAEVGTRLNELRHDFYDPQRPPAASKALVKGVGLDRRRLTLDLIAVPRE